MQSWVRVGRWPVFAIVALAGVFVCFWHIGQQVLDGDELIYVQAGWQYVHGVVTFNLEHPPTAKYLYGLAQLVVGQGVLGPRLVAGTAVFATGVVLFLWLRGPLGHWGALLAAGLWWLTPRANGPDAFDPGSGTAVRIDRIALLEPVMVFFVVLALAAAWAWITTSSRWRWAWAAVAGAALGLAVTSKATGALFVVAIVVLPILFRRWWELLVGGVIAAAAFAVTFVASYAPVGMVRGLTYMLDFQSAHDANGHLAEIAGHTYRFAPWWSQYWYMVVGTTPVLVAVLVVGIVAALFVRPDQLVVYLLAAIIPVMVFFGASKVALAHYYDAWMPVVIALAAVGFARLGQSVSLAVRVRTGHRAGRRVPVAATTVIAAVVVLGVGAAVVPATQQTVAVARVRPSGLALLDRELRAHGVDGGRILFTEYGAPGWRPYFADRGVDVPVAGRYGAIVQGTDDRFPVPEQVRAFLSAERSRLTAFRIDDLRVWVPAGGGAIVIDGGAVSLQR
ncbi:phospholipid carrier-dependent glycosyltransferase [Curtobacterium sp. MCBA15_008]|uniref:phospholipid carrier-dependent glycosyltransferase n=1 Tax=Curtobacterium sp. MCBA15_008 TaxID=1898736 RepID=UPI000ABEFCE9|nr:phospholipid carrier-dependent glycosyltransferase [Curtobacterium sp. MCBA15_008]